MQLKYFGLKGGEHKTLVVLGAGASRGASFVENTAKILPPLDLDFFQHLSRLESPGEDGKRLIEFVRKEFDSELGLSLEEFLSTIDLTIRSHREFGAGRATQITRYRRAMDYFMRTLPRVLHASTNVTPCTYHSIIAGRLRPDDAVITFNYDCVMDLALKEAGGNRWNPKRGYGFSIKQGGDFWRRRTRGKRPSRSIRLLKMHGSMNWGRNRRLVSDLKAVKTLQHSIIPPTWFKDLREPRYKKIWAAARNEARDARILVVVGYSVPPTDLYSRSLFKVEVGCQSKLALLVLVNPDREARHKFRRLVANGIGPKTVVLEYNTLEELASILQPATAPIETPALLPERNPASAGQSIKMPPKGSIQIFYDPKNTSCWRRLDMQGLPVPVWRLGIIAPNETQPLRALVTVDTDSIPDLPQRLHPMASRGTGAGWEGDGSFELWPNSPAYIDLIRYTESSKRLSLILQMGDLVIPLQSYTFTISVQTSSGVPATKQFRFEIGQDGSNPRLFEQQPVAPGP